MVVIAIRMIIHARGRVIGAALVRIVGMMGEHGRRPALALLLTMLLLNVLLGERDLPNLTVAYVVATCSLQALVLFYDLL